MGLAPDTLGAACPVDHETQPPYRIMGLVLAWVIAGTCSVHVLDGPSGPELFELHSFHYNLTSRSDS
jgi:hypothetical protein